MSYDEPDYEEPPPPEPNREPIKIAVETEISFGEVLDRVAWKAIEVFKRSYNHENGSSIIGDIIERTITSAIEKRAATLIEERVEAEVSRILAEGWDEPKADYGYDRSAPKHVTLQSFVQHALTRQIQHGDDRYNNISPGTLIDRTFERFMKAELAKMLGEELAAAKKRFTEAVDRLIEGKVVEAARAALKGER